MADLVGTRTIFVCPLDSRGAAEALDAELGTWARSRQVAILDVATAYKTPDGRLKLERDWDWWSIAAAAGGVVLAPTIVGALIGGAIAGAGTTMARRKLGRRMSTNMIKRVASHLDAGRALYLVAVKPEFDGVLSEWLAGRGVEATMVPLDAAAEAEILEALGAPVPGAVEGPGGPVRPQNGAVATGSTVPPAPGTVETWGELFGTAPGTPPAKADENGEPDPVDDAAGTTQGAKAADPTP